MTDCSLFYFITWGVIVGLICIYGMVGNSLSLVAFQRDKRMPATTLLQCLAASDFVMLLTVFIIDSVPYICDYTATCANPWYTWPYIRYIWMLMPISHMCSVWFVVLISLNRFWAVCRATEMNLMWNMTKTWTYIGTVLFSVIVFNMPRFFEYTVVNTQTGNSTWKLEEQQTEFGLTLGYKKVYKSWLVVITQLLIPLTLLLFFTVRILFTLNRSSSRIKTGSDSINKHSKHNASMKNRARSHSEITLVLIAVVIVTIICQAPLGVFHFARLHGDYYCGDIVFYLENISKMLVSLNSSANFLIYCVASRKFRRLLKSVVNCKAVDMTDTFGASVYRLPSLKKSPKRKDREPNDRDGAFTFNANAEPNDDKIALEEVNGIQKVADKTQVNDKVCFDNGHDGRPLSNHSENHKLSHIELADITYADSDGVKPTHV